MKWPGGVLLVCFPNKMRSLFLKCVFVSCSWRDGHLMCVLIPEVQQDRGTSVPTAFPAVPRLPPTCGFDPVSLARGFPVLCLLGQDHH